MSYHALFTALLCCCALAVTSAQSCRRSERCLSIDSCDQFRSLLLRKPLTRETIDFLRRSQCGFQGSRPLVCCPTSQPQVTGTSRAPPRSTARPNTGGTTRNIMLPSQSDCGLGVMDRIFGGNETALGEFPWMALLEYNTQSGRAFQCGGALINNRYVLTAAHCIRDVPRNWRLLGVRLGEHDTRSNEDCEENGVNRLCSDPPQDFSIDNVIVHPEYRTADKNKYNDIALLRLNRDVSYTTYVRPVCLPTGRLETRSYDGSRLTVAGWGRTENGGASPVKLKVDLPVLSNAECNPIYRSVQLSEKQMCAGGVSGMDSCRGDSGGPLMSVDAVDGVPHWTVAGVVSIGPEFCGTAGRPGIYTRVGRYMDWILGELEP